EATAVGRIRLREESVKRILKGEIEKGDPLSAARLAVVLAVKQTSMFIPLCHPLPVTAVEVYEEVGKDFVELKVKVKASAKTGVEMEALTGVCSGLLTVWDMTKQYEKDQYGQYPTTRIEGIRVVEKIKETLQNE
ncbi:MAG: cyclic pyranopterin monophosphate synthase MoaC, partial [Candidatus Bathyarchaeia archaeon]